MTTYTINKVIEQITDFWINITIAENRQKAFKN